MKARFVLLAILSGVFMIAFLPVGILFFVLVCMYYLKSETRDDSGGAYPDFKKLLGSRGYADAQKRLK